MSTSEKVYELKNSLPNKLLQDDGTITDIAGNPVTNTVTEYDNSPSLPNKFMNPDGSYSTLNEIIASMIDVDIFVPVQELPEIGEDNKIYLIPNGRGTFDEYFWNGSKWDKIGELDISNLATKSEVEQCLIDAKAYVDKKIKEYVPLQAFSNYPAINTTGTTSEFFESIKSLKLPVGSLLLGGAKLNDIDDIAPGMVNEEIRVEVYPNNVFHAVMTSTDVEPYEWSIQYWKGTERWIPMITVNKVQEMIDRSVTDVLGGEY